MRFPSVGIYKGLLIGALIDKNAEANLDRSRYENSSDIDISSERYMHIN